MRSLVPALALAYLACSCTLNTDYFAEYRGVNLLGNYDFDAVESDGVTAKWKLATSSDFVRWERTPATGDPGTVPTVGPDGVSPVYRVEIKNLIPNGDFEDTAKTNDGDSLPRSFWKSEYYDGTTAQGSPTAVFGPSFTSSQQPTVGAITGRILGWDGGTSGNHLALDFKAAVSSTGAAAWSAGRYVLRVDLMNLSQGTQLGMFPYTNQPPTYGVVDNPSLAAPDWTVNTVDDMTAVYSTVNTFITSTNANSEPRVLVVGASKGSEGPFAAAIDNVRVVPDDQLLGVRADFLSLESGVKPLLPGSRKGMYRFSVWVLNDPTAGTLNRFQPKELTVRVEARVKSGDPSFLSSPGLRPAGGWTVWTQLQFDMGFDFVNADADLNGSSALSILLIPTNGSTGNSDAGSVLVSQPVLTFNP